MPKFLDLAAIDSSSRRSVPISKKVENNYSPEKFKSCWILDRFQSKGKRLIFGKREQDGLNTRLIVRTFCVLNVHRIDWLWVFHSVIISLLEGNINLQFSILNISATESPSSILSLIWYHSCFVSKTGLKSNDDHFLCPNWARIDRHLS